MASLGRSLLLVFACVCPVVRIAADGSASSLVRTDKHRATSSSSLTEVSVGRTGTLERGRQAESPKLKRQYPFFHTTEELHTEAKALRDKCGGALKSETWKDGKVALDVYTVKKPGSTPINRAFFVFGEHSRELISPESGLGLLKTLCEAMEGKGAANQTNGTGADKALSALETNEFRIVLNANPRSRKKVEEGQYCIRTNPDGVDLNRNWDEKWEGGDADGEENPGPKPFSEPETRILKELVTHFKPTTFLTVHSGTYGMYMPWAYDMEHQGSFNRMSMMEILANLDKTHCQCPFGAAGKEVGYPCPGTSVDYAYGVLETPYSFAWEIYAPDSEKGELRDRWQEKVDSGGQALLEKGAHLGHAHFRSLFDRHHSDFVRGGKHRDLEHGARSSFDCFGQFNPREEKVYKDVVHNWVGAYLEMASLVAETMRQNGTNATASAALQKHAESHHRHAHRHDHHYF